MKKYFLRRTYIVLCISLGGVAPAVAQNVNVEEVTNLKNKQKLKLNGGISANATLFHSNEMVGRQAFSYQLNGNLNLSLMELMNIPLSFSLNNYGSQFTYPTLPNRLSLHPSYKWIRCHIGDVAMSFSPYTLNGHQFTGGGVELSPGKWTFAAMGGRLLRKVDYQPALPQQPPTYERWGYGVKTRYSGSKFFLGGTFFTAKDRLREASFRADSMGIFPKSNIAMSVEGGVSIIKNLTLSAEYAVSVLTRDTRSPKTTGAGIIDRWMQRRESTHFYYAVKAALEYTLFKNTLALGYERISPQYETLGAYYFNNDYENVTLSYARPLWGDKANIALSGGVQRDDLDQSKKEKNKRIIGTINFTYTPTERLNTSVSASTFQGYRNIKSQFDYVNATTPYENLDTLNFRQISQNVDVNLNWIMSQSEKRNQNLMLFISYQEAADKQGTYILPGNLSRFLNSSATYGVDFTTLNMNVNVGMNVSNNYSNMKNFLTWGPTLSATVGLFEKTLHTGLSLSYNRSQEGGVPLASVYNCRWNVNYRLFKKHGLQVNTVFQQRDLKTGGIQRNVYSLTTSFGYFYSF